MVVPISVLSWAKTWLKKANKKQGIKKYFDLIGIV